MTMTKATNAATDDDNNDDDDVRLLGLLDLPSQSLITVDGVPIVLQRSDFVGVVMQPMSTQQPLPVALATATTTTDTMTTTTDDTALSSSFHLVVTQASCVSPRKHQQKSSVSSFSSSLSSSSCAGFVIPNQGHFIRRFDPAMEELSSSPVDSVTIENLIIQLRHGHLTQHPYPRVLEYRQVVSPLQQKNWSDMTYLIASTLLVRRGLKMGEKIVPSLYENEVDNNSNYTTEESDSIERTVPPQAALSSPRRTNADGNAAHYPPIPLLGDAAATMRLRGNVRRRHAQHVGTKRFLARLDPSQRTHLLLLEDPPEEKTASASSSSCQMRALYRYLLPHEYGHSWRDLVGDVQLSYVLFLQLHCWSSFTHWRDLITMLSFTIGDTSSLCPFFEEDVTHDELYCALLQTLAVQVNTMEPDFFDEMELSQENAILPALQRLLTLRQRKRRRLVRDTKPQHPHHYQKSNDDHDMNSSQNRLTNAVLHLHRALQRRFPSHFPLETDMEEEVRLDGQEQHAENILLHGHCHNDDFPTRDKVTGSNSNMRDYHDENDVDEDGPVVIPTEEWEASLVRIAIATPESSSLLAEGSMRQQPKQQPVMTVTYSSDVQRQYPFLFAAKLQSEDIVMTCARALDQANDVTLVREAADYLQKFEGMSRQ